MAEGRDMTPVDDVAGAAPSSWLDRWQRLSGWFLVIGAVGGLILKFGGLAGWCDDPEGCGPGYASPLASEAAVRIVSPATGVGIGLLSSLGVIGLFGLAAPIVRGRRPWLAVGVLIAVGFAASLVLNIVEALWMRAPWITSFNPRSLIASESQVAVRSAIVLGLGLTLLRPRPSIRLLGSGLAVGGGLWLGKIALVAASGDAPLGGWPVLLYQAGMWVLLLCAGWIAARGIRSRDPRPLSVVAALVVIGMVLEGAFPYVLRGELGLSAIALTALAAGIRAQGSGRGRPAPA